MKLIVGSARTRPEVGRAAADMLYNLSQDPMIDPAATDRPTIIRKPEKLEQDLKEFKLL